MSARAYPDFPYVANECDKWAAHYVREVMQRDAMQAVRVSVPCFGALWDAAILSCAVLDGKVRESLSLAIGAGGLLLCWVPDGAGQGAA